MAVDFQEQNSNDEAGALVAVEERMVAEDAGGIGSGERRRVRVVALGLELLRSSEGGLQQTAVAQARETSIEGQQSAMEGKCVALVDP